MNVIGGRAAAPCAAASSETTGTPGSTPRQAVEDHRLGGFVGGGDRGLVGLGPRVERAGSRTARIAAAAADDDRR